MSGWFKKNAFWAAAAILTASLLIGHADSVKKSIAKEIVFNDFSILNYQVESAKQFHTQTGNLWGYDPHFMAGYPLSFVWNSNIAIQWLAVRMPNLDSSQVVSSVLIWGLFLFPLIWWLSLLVFGLNFRESAASFVIGSLYFMAGLPVLFFYTGMLTAGLLVSFSVLAAAFLYRYSRDGKLWFLGVFITFPAALFLHKTAILVLFPVWLMALAYSFRQKSVLRLGGLFVAAILAWESNLIWIDPLFYFMPYMQEVKEAPFWRNTDILLPLKEYFTGRAVMNTLTFDGLRGVVHSITIAVILVTAAYGAKVWAYRGQRARARVLLIPAAVLWIFVFYGGFFKSAGELNPTRYFSIVNMFLAVASGTAIVYLAEHKGMAGKIVSGIIIAASIGGIVWLSDWYFPFRLLVSRPASPVIEELEKEIRNLPGDGRIMIEDSGDMDVSGAGQVYGGAHLLSRFGTTTGKEFIGGPYPYVYLKHRYASFYDATVFGKKISDISPGEMVENLKLYDIKWIVAWSGESMGYLEKYNGIFNRISDVDDFNIYEVTGYEANRFISGTGVIRADYGKIIVTGAKAGEGGEIVLKYHWPVAFTSLPKLKMEVYKAGNDPVGFIKIVDPPENFVITVP